MNLLLIWWHWWKPDYNKNLWWEQQIWYPWQSVNNNIRDLCRAYQRKGLLFDHNLKTLLVAIFFFLTGIILIISSLLKNKHKNLSLSISSWFDGPFHSCEPTCQAFDLEWGWGWPCCDRNQYLLSMITK